jgi:hypothetical protein
MKVAGSNDGQQLRAIMTFDDAPAGADGAKPDAAISQ